MSCATFKATTENPSVAPFTKGGGPKDRGIFASSRYFHKRRKDAKVTGRCPSSRTNARDLREISPSGRNDNDSELGALASWREEYPSPRFLQSGKFAQASQTVSFCTGQKISPNKKSERRGGWHAPWGGGIGVATKVAWARQTRTRSSRNLSGHPFPSVRPEPCRRTPKEFVSIPLLQPVTPFGPVDKAC